eukprot:2050691-Ditylum_brightwellii.AAC.1
MHYMFLRIAEKGKIYSNQTGHFPHTSSKGAKYIMVIHHQASTAEDPNIQHNNPPSPRVEQENKTI